MRNSNFGIGFSETEIIAVGQLLPHHDNFMLLTIVIIVRGCDH